MDSFQAREIEAGDPLGYDLFASALARSILNVNAEESIVYGLSGEWGSGKSSILKTVAKELQGAEKAGDGNEKPPIVVQFKPWWFSGTDVLALEFFKALWGKIGVDWKGKSKEALGFIKPFIAPLTSSAMNFVSNASGGTSEGALANEALAKYLDSVADGYLDLLEEDTAGAKERIAKRLRDKQQRIVVIIDELDRLLPGEIIQVLQLIRAVGDLPYVIYLVAFEEEAVLATLAKEGIRKPSDYLEKMFQLRLTVPRPSVVQLEKLVVEKLLKWVDVDVNSFKGNNERRWNAAFRLELRNEFTTPRDVIRFVNQVKITYPVVKEHLNVVDFLILVALRTLDPRLDGQILANRTLLLQTPGDMVEAARKAVTRDAKQEKEVVAEFFPGISEPRGQALRALFPAFRRVLSGKGGEELFSDEDRFGRICDPASFEAFFVLSPANGQLTRRELEELLGGDPKVLAQRIRSRWSEDREATMSLVGYLRGMCGEENARGSANLLAALLEVEGPEFHNMGPVMGALQAAIEITRIDDRKRIIAVFRECKNLEAAVRVLAPRGGQTREWDAEFQTLSARLVEVSPRDLMASWAKPWIAGVLWHGGGLQDPAIRDTGVGLMLALHAVKRQEGANGVTWMSDVGAAAEILSEDRFEIERRVEALLADRPEWWSEAETEAAKGFLHDRRQMPAPPMQVDEPEKEENGNDADLPETTDRVRP